MGPKAKTSLLRPDDPRLSADPAVKPSMHSLIAHQFKPGQLANPGGRPKVDLILRAAAREHAQEAIDCILGIMMSGEPDQTRLNAAKELLDRCYGKPRETTENLNVNVDGGRITYRIVLGETKGDES